jgi:hypothetical protein
VRCKFQTIPYEEHTPDAHSHNEVLNICYTSKTWQFSDPETIIVAAERIPMKHFNTIRTLHIDAKAIPWCSTAFVTRMHSFPASYQQRFKHLAPPAKGLAGRVLRRVDTEAVLVWQAVCDVIGSMEALKNLRLDLCKKAFIVWLVCGRPRVQITGESFVFGPLAEIGKRRDLDVFRVRVDWPLGDVEAWSEEADKGFELIRLAEGSFPGWESL